MNYKQAGRIDEVSTNNRNYNANTIENTSELLTRNKRSSVAKTVIIVFIIIIVFGLIILGIYHFMHHNKKDVALEIITSDELKGSYYSTDYFTDDLGDHPYIIDIDEETIEAHIDGYNYSEALFKYRTRNVDEGTFFEIIYEDSTESFPLAYYKDLGVLWIGGEDSLLLFKNNDKTYDYIVKYTKQFYSDNDYAERYLRGKWRDVEDNNNNFEYTINGLEDINISNFNWKHVDMTGHSDVYSFGVSYQGFDISERKDIIHEDNGAISSRTKYGMIVVPISDNECIVFYTDCEKGKSENTLYGHGTIFERVPE